MYDRTTGGIAETIERIGDAQAVYTNKTPLPREVFEACPSIRFVGVLATGYNVIDIRAARERNIPVANVPSTGPTRWGSSPSGCCLRYATHRAPQPGGARGGLGEESGLVLLGLPAY